MQPSITVDRLLSKPLLAFSFSAFAFGLSEFVVLGLLTQISEAIGVDISQSGLLITAYALGVSLGSPTLAYATRKIPSKPICVRLILVFVLANLASAMTQNIALILIARLIAGVMHGTYLSIASTVAPVLVAPNKAPLAIAIMFSGFTVAMVLGVPAGIALGHMAGWESVFVAMAILSTCAGLLIHLYMPNLRDAIDSDNEAPLVTYFARRLVRFYGITIFGFGGGFVFFSYVEPYLRYALTLGPVEIARSLMIIGVGSLFGNILGGKLLAALGSSRGLASAIALQAIVLVGIALTTELPVIFHMLLFFWSIACFSVAPMVQTAVVMLASDHEGLNPRLTVGLNATAFNIGISVAAFCASRLVAVTDVSYLPFAAALAVSVALPLCLQAESFSNRRC